MDIIFINNESLLSGAPIFLYEYVLYLQHDYKILIIDINYNKQIEEAYYNLLLIKPIFLHNDINKIIETINSYNPKVIYSNSINCFFTNLEIIPENLIQKTIFHFHEVLNDIPKHNELFNKILNNKVFVVNNNIKNDILNKYNFSDIQVFTPYLSKSKFAILDCNNENNNNILKKYNNKIIFGMLGYKSFRKGYDIFMNIVKNMPDHMFVWIGGDYDYDKNNIYDNYIQINYLSNPYILMNNFDYLLNTSRCESFSLIIIEALYMNIPCIMLDGNISYNHNVINYYKIKDHNNDYLNIIKYINNMNLIKKNTTENITKDYVIENFSDKNIKKLII